jgi:hypothetical protein
LWAFVLAFNPCNPCNPWFISALIRGNPWLNVERSLRNPDTLYRDSCS